MFIRYNYVAHQSLQKGNDESKEGCVRCRYDCRFGNVVFYNKHSTIPGGHQLPNWIFPKWLGMGQVHPITAWRRPVQSRRSVSEYLHKIRILQVRGYPECA